LLFTSIFTFSGWLATSAGIFGNAQLKMDLTSKLKVPDVQLTFSAITKNLAEEKKEEPKNKVRVNMSVQGVNGDWGDERELK
jgi:hypothetical protein